MRNPTSEPQGVIPSGLPCWPLTIHKVATISATIPDCPYLLLASPVVNRCDPGEQIVGVVDVDNAGRGQVADDYASLLGQLAAMAITSSRRKAIAAYSDTLLDAFDQVTDPRDLRLRTAAVILGLATGPFRVQRATWPAETRRRIKLTQNWIAAAATTNRHSLGAEV